MVQVVDTLARSRPTLPTVRVSVPLPVRRAGGAVARMVSFDGLSDGGDHFALVFDCPDAALARPRRTVSTTVLQALNLLNGRFVLAQACHFADRLRREAGDDPERQVTLAFRLAFGREPSERERVAAVALVRDHGAAALCRALYNANEFLYVD